MDPAGQIFPIPSLAGCTETAMRAFVGDALRNFIYARQKIIPEQGQVSERFGGIWMSAMKK